METNDKHLERKDTETRKMIPVIFALAWPTMLEQLM